VHIPLQQVNCIANAIETCKNKKTQQLKPSESADTKQLKPRTSAIMNAKKKKIKQQTKGEKSLQFFREIATNSQIKKINKAA